MKRAFAVVVAVLLLLSSGPATLAEAGVGFAPAALRGTGPNSIREVYCDGLFRAYARDKRAVGRELRNGPIKGWFVYDEVANLSGKRGVEQGKFSELAIAMRVGWLVRVPYATRGGAKTVFRSGGEGAKRGAAGFAERTGGRTLEMTAVGRELEAAALPWSQAKPLWEAASRDLATSARGHVDVLMSRAARPDSIWRTIERPALQSNPNVTGIRIHLPVVQ